MKHNGSSLLTRALRDQSGQTLPWVALMMTMMLGTGAFVLDVGHVFVCYRELQASTDAAALAGAQSLPNTSATTMATSFSSTTGGKNTNYNLGTVSMVAGYPKLKCLTTLTNMGMACIAPANANAIQVRQNSTVPTFFAGIFGVHTMTITASATASMRGAARAPYNVAIVIDTTASMNSADNGNCVGTRISCALKGVQVLLNSLSPCMSSLSSCGTATNGHVPNAIDEVAIFTYPPVSTPANDYNCSGSNPGVISYPDATNNVAPYPNSTTAQGPLTSYQITGLMSDYRTSDTATLNTSSNLTHLVAAKSGCPGMQSQGGVGTYFGGAVATAQAYLVSQQPLRPTSQNVIIVLSDGDASSGASFSSSNTYLNSNGTYPSKFDMCQQAVLKAQAATAAGTKVYTVAYGAASSGGCSTDTPYISPCNTLKNMASSALTFFADTTSGCASLARPTTTLNQIFTQIAQDLSLSRLIPDGTT